MKCSLNIAWQSLAALTLLTTSAWAITDGSLSADVFRNSFNSVSLNGSPFYTDQEHSSMGSIRDGNTGNAWLVQGSAVVNDGPRATYSGQTVDGIDVAATVRILGPLASKPTTSNVLEHEFVLTNNTDRALPLALVFFTNPGYLHLDHHPTHDEGPQDERAAYDAATKSLFEWNHEARNLVATIALDPAHQAAFGFDVGIYDERFPDSDEWIPDRTFPLKGRAGPVGPGSVATTIGLDYRNISAGQTVTAIFRHLFDTDTTTVPPDFTFVPEPETWVVLSLGGLALVRKRRARRL